MSTKVKASTLEVGNALQLASKNGPKAGEPYASARWVTGITKTGNKLTVEWAAASALKTGIRKGGTVGKLEVSPGTLIERRPDDDARFEKFTAAPVTVTNDPSIVKGKGKPATPAGTSLSDLTPEQIAALPEQVVAKLMGL